MAGSIDRRTFLGRAGAAAAVLTGAPLVTTFRATAAADRLVVAVPQWGTETPFAWRSAIPEKVRRSTWTFGPRQQGVCHMAMNDEQLEAEIMKLELDARARLAERLILSLDAPPDEENLRLRVAEAERRLRDLREGRAKEMYTCRGGVAPGRASHLMRELTFHEEADAEVQQAAGY